MKEGMIAQTEKRDSQRGERKSQQDQQICLPSPVFVDNVRRRRDCREIRESFYCEIFEASGVEDERYELKSLKYASMTQEQRKCSTEVGMVENQRPLQLTIQTTQKNFHPPHRNKKNKTYMSCTNRHQSTRIPQKQPPPPSPSPLQISSTVPQQPTKQ